MRKRACSFGAVLSSTLAIAYMAPPVVHAKCDTQTKAVAIFHINGINTTEKQAQDNAAALAETVRDNGLSNSVYLAYNWSYREYTNSWVGGAIDGLSATIQGALSAIQDSVKYSFSMVSKSLFFWDNLGLTDGVNNAVQAKVDELASSVMRLTDIKVGNTSQIIADINHQTSNTAPLLLVPHSQGNFYANAIYGDLSQTRPVKIVSVATPTPFTAGDGDYVNSANDRVVTDIVPTARRWNVAIPYTPKDSLGHSFTDVYLDPVLAVGRQAVLELLVCRI